MHSASMIQRGAPVFYVCWLQIEGQKQVARRSDMDMNGHINNVTYLAWALETLPQQVYDNYKLFEVGMNCNVLCIMAGINLGARELQLGCLQLPSWSGSSPTHSLTR
jgi:hypothetical protein